jgi:hypothetical protein
MKLIGAGFGRTGTLSLKKALEILGFGPCYHMQVTFFNPWHLPFWYKASIGKNVNWKKFFKRYKSTVDWPASAFYKELMNEYPDAKVILHVREPETWYESAFKTIYTMSRSFPFWFPKQLIKMQENVIWQGIFEGRFQDRELAISKFRKHVENVKKCVPEDRLLIFDVKEGWAPLCKFLDVPVPENISFPHRNEAKKYILLIKFVRLVEWLAPAMVFISVLLIWYFWL